MASLPSMQSVTSALNGTAGSVGVAGGDVVGADGVDIMDVKRRRHQSFAAANYMRNHLPAYMVPVPSPIKQAGAAIVRGSSQRSNLNRTYPGPSGHGANDVGLGMSAESLSGHHSSTHSFRVAPQHSARGSARGRGSRGDAAIGDGSRIRPHAPNAMQLLFGNGRPGSHASRASGGGRRGSGGGFGVDTSGYGAMDAARGRSPASGAKPVTPLNLSASMGL